VGDLPIRVRVRVEVRVGVSSQKLGGRPSGGGGGFTMKPMSISSAIDSFLRGIGTS